MGIRDTQPPSYEQSTRNKVRVKTSQHVCTHPKRERRRQRALSQPVRSVNE
jgi:hypothetical protein